MRPAQAVRARSAARVPLGLCALVAAALLSSGCGLHPTGPTDGGRAPTGVAPGMTLYFVDGDGELKAQQRESGRLGSVSDAVSLLLTGPGPTSGLRTEIAPVPTTRVAVTTAPDVLTVVVPLSVDEVTPQGIDQIVCTALGAHVQQGGSTGTKVQVRFTLGTAESEEHRTCPLIG
ncbi:GerMN domain-containing protein [Nocardiopsis halophila]|uniref:GerMN domain-containing protein n=1 Tax=Nocardiopsis halophila TaxID=141692 RepID=UPI0003453C02|nr:GerMN domain-containing protein [Nocardiopsis halophila]